MERREALRLIDSTLKAHGFVDVGPGAADYEGQIKVHGQSVDVKVEIPDVFFTKKTRVFLKDKSQIPVQILAHVEEQTGVCYSSGAGLPIDLYEPGQAILRILEEVQITLELSYANRGVDELIDEYQHYWDGGMAVRCFFSKSSIEKEQKGVRFFAQQGDTVRFVALGDDLKLAGYKTKLSDSALIWKMNGRVVPIGTIAAPSNLFELEEWYLGQPDSGTHDWLRGLRHLAQGGSLYFEAENAFVGVELDIPRHILMAVKNGRIRKKKLPELLLRNREKVATNRTSATLASLEDISMRNVAENVNLSNTSIALVGCGTIGSHLARMLVQCGAGTNAKLSLFDPETLTEGNLGRHLLGLSYVGFGKAKSTSEELLRFHPQVQVSAYEEDALARPKTLTQHDLIIDATGDWNVQSALNEWFLHLADQRPQGLLHCWIFMNGAGVQSFLNLLDKYACFRCLKPRFEGPWRFPAGDERDKLNIKPASCGDGSFVPFTVDASVGPTPFSWTGRGLSL